MRYTGPLFTALVALAIAVSATAETFKVYADGSGAYATIIEAIWASDDGDTVQLGDGVYTGEGNRDLANSSRWILIRSESGAPEQCIIDCEGSPADPHHGIWLDITGSKASAARIAFGLDGITITNAHAHSGAAVHISDGAMPTIRNCRFINNTAEHEGGVVTSDESGGIFENCLFSGNHAQSGGAMHLGAYFHLDATGCTFVGNSADVGGAIVLRMSSYHCRLANCTFSGNSAATAAHFYLTESSAVILDNCILAFGETGPALVCEPGSSASLTCCDLFGNQGGDWTGSIADQLGVSGNISADPFFCAPAALDYRIASNSPCAPFSAPNEECDLIGAQEVGCGPVSVARESWGRIKGRYR